MENKEKIITNISNEILTLSKLLKKMDNALNDLDACDFSSVQIVHFDSKSFDKYDFLYDVKMVSDEDQEKAFKEHQESLEKKHAEQIMEDFHATMILENHRKSFDMIKDTLNLKQKSAFYKSPKDHWWRNSNKKKFKKR